MLCYALPLYSRVFGYSPPPATKVLRFIYLLKKWAPNDLIIDSSNANECETHQNDDGTKIYLLLELRNPCPLS